MSWISSSRLLLRSSLWTSRSISIQVQNCRYISTPSFFGFSPSKKIQCLPFSPLIQPSQQQHNFSVSPISQNKKEWNLDDLKDDVKFDDLNNLLSGLPDGKEWFMEQGNYRVAKFYDEEAFPTRRVRYPIPNKEGLIFYLSLLFKDFFIEGRGPLSTLDKNRIFVLSSKLFENR